MKSVLTFIILFVACLRVWQSAAAEFHVSGTGSDANPGTDSAPFYSIERAQQAVRSLVADGMSEDIIVNLHQGTYRLRQPLIFHSQDGGTEDQRITYRAYGGGQVIISGGKVVSGWQKDTQGRWFADPAAAGKVRELFVNGRRAQRARHPDSGFFRAGKAAADRMTYFTFNPGDIPETASAEGIELVFIHDWSISRTQLEKIDFSDNRIYPCAKLGRQHPMMVIDGFEPNPRYFLENDPAFCDSPGEWYQTADGRLVYFPLEGEKIAETEIVIPHTPQLIVIRGDETSGSLVQNLHFSGMIFEHCAFDLPVQGYAGVQATFHQVDEESGFEKGWRGMVPAAISVELAKDCGLNDITLRHLGGTGLMFGSRTVRCSLTNSTLVDISGNGIMIGESWNRQIGEEPWWRAAPEQAATADTVKNCLIEDCGVQYAGAVGIWVGLARYTQIRQNELRNLPYTGISIGWMWNPQPTPCMGNIVENNHIHHVMQVLSDGGGIYTLGYQPGTILRGNLIHDIPLNAGRAESNGMFLDEGTTDIEITKNAIYNTARSPLRFHKARVNRVIENVFGIPAGLAPVRYNRTDEKDIHLINNTILLTGEEKDAGLENALRPWRDKAGRERR
jgi:hypothetical protein